jgi:hypothetical protein
MIGNPMTGKNLPAPHDGRCGATTRGGTPCTQPAGWGTDSTAGRCKLHGGKSHLRHGRYSRIRHEVLRDLIEQYEADPDPLNLLAELAAARALFQDFIERYDANRDALLAWHESWQKDGGTVGRPRQVLDIADAYRLLSEVTKIAKRIEDIRAQNAVSRPDLIRIMTEMGRVVERHVTDERSREKIKDGWLEIRL